MKPAQKKPTQSQIAREKAKQQTYEALVDAATQLFAIHGLDVSLADVCARAGYTRGAFYVHFKDREELILTVMERVGDQALKQLLEPAGKDSSFAELVGGFFLSLTSGDYPLTKEGGLRPYQLLDACARSTAIRDKYISLCSRAVERLTEKLKLAQSNNELRADVPAERLAFILLAVVIGVHTLYDLDYPLELPANAMALGQMIAPIQP